MSASSSRSSSSRRALLLLALAALTALASLSLPVNAGYLDFSQINSSVSYLGAPLRGFPSLYTVELWLRWDNAFHAEFYSSIIGFPGCVPAFDAGGIPTSYYPPTLSPTLDNFFGLLIAPTFQVGANHQNGPPFVWGPNITLHVWTHIALTFNGTDRNLYINGSLVASTPLGAINPPQDGELVLGQEPDCCPWSTGDVCGTDPQRFEGSIDELRIWSRARTGSEIYGSYASPVYPNDRDLFAYYTFDSINANGGFSDSAQFGYHLRPVGPPLPSLFVAAASAPICPLIVTLNPTNTYTNLNGPAYGQYLTRYGPRFNVIIETSVPLASPLNAGHIAVTNGSILAVADMGGGGRSFIATIAATPLACSPVTVTIPAGALTAAPGPGLPCMHPAASVFVPCYPATLQFGTSTGVTGLPAADTTGSIVRAHIFSPLMPYAITATLTLTGTGEAALWLPDGEVSDSMPGQISNVSVVLTLPAGESTFPPVYIAYLRPGTVTVTITLGGLINGAASCVFPPSPVTVTVTAVTVTATSGLPLLIASNGVRFHDPMPTRARAATMPGCGLPRIDTARLWLDRIATDCPWMLSRFAVSVPEFLASAPLLLRVFPSVILADSAPYSAALVSVLRATANSVLVSNALYLLPMGLATAVASAPVASAVAVAAPHSLGVNSTAAFALFPTAADSRPLLVATLNPLANATVLVAESGPVARALVYSYGPGVRLADNTFAAGIRVGACFGEVSGTGLHSWPNGVSTGGPVTAPALLYLMRTALTALAPQAITLATPAGFSVSPEGRRQFRITASAAAFSLSLPAFTVALIERYGPPAPWARAETTLIASLVSPDLAEHAWGEDSYVEAPLYTPGGFATAAGGAVLSPLRVGGLLTNVRLRVIAPGTPLPAVYSPYFDVLIDNAAVEASPDYGVAELVLAGPFPSSVVAAVRLDTLTLAALPAALTTALGAATVNAVAFHCSPAARPCAPDRNELMLGLSGAPAGLANYEVSASAYTTLAIGGSVLAIADENARGFGAVVGDFNLGNPNIDVVGYVDGFVFPFTSNQAAMNIQLNASVAMRAAALIRVGPGRLMRWLVGGDAVLAEVSLTNGSRPQTVNLPGVTAMAASEAFGYAYLGRNAPAVAAGGNGTVGPALLVRYSIADRSLSPLPGAAWLAAPHAVLAAECTAAAIGPDRAQACWFGGSFVDGTGGGRNRIARFDGGNLTALGGTGISGGAVLALHYDPFSDYLYVGGTFTAGMVPGCASCAYLTRIRGNGAGGFVTVHTSTTLPGGLGPVSSLAIRYLPPTQVRLRLAQALPATVLRGDSFDVVLSIPTPSRRAGFTLSYARLRVASAASEGDGLVAPYDYMALQTEFGHSELILFTVRATRQGVLRLSAELHESTGRAHPQPLLLNVTVLPREASAPRRTSALLVLMSDHAVSPTRRLAYPTPWEHQSVSDFTMSEVYTAAFDALYIMQSTWFTSGYARGGYDAIIYGESSGSGDMSGEAVRHPVFVLSQESYVSDDSLLSSAEPYAFGTAIADAYFSTTNSWGYAPVTSTLAVVNGSHPLAGYAPVGPLRVVSFPTSVNHVRPLPSAYVIARPMYLPDGATIVLYPSGAELFDCRVTPAPRVMHAATILAQTYASPTLFQTMVASSAFAVTESAERARAFGFDPPPPPPAAMPSPPPSPLSMPPPPTRPAPVPSSLRPLLGRGKATSPEVIAAYVAAALLVWGVIVALISRRQRAAKYLASPDVWERVTIDGAVMQLHSLVGITAAPKNDAVGRGPRAAGAVLSLALHLLVAAATPALRQDAAGGTPFDSAARLRDSVLTAILALALAQVIALPLLRAAVGSGRRQLVHIGVGLALLATALSAGLAAAMLAAPASFEAKPNTSGVLVIWAVASAVNALVLEPLLIVFAFLAMGVTHMRRRSAAQLASGQGKSLSSVGVAEAVTQADDTAGSDTVRSTAELALVDEAEASAAAAGGVAAAPVGRGRGAAEASAESCRVESSAAASAAAKDASDASGSARPVVRAATTTTAPRGRGAGRGAAAAPAAPGTAPAGRGVTGTAGGAVRPGRPRP